MTDYQILKVVKPLKYHYYINIALACFLFVAALFYVHHTTQKISLSLALNQYMILLDIAFIPLILRWFSTRIKKSIKQPDQEKIAKIYCSAYHIRLYAISAVFMLNFSLYAMTGSNNYMWLTIIVLTIYLFCKPSAHELKALVKPDKIESVETEGNSEGNDIEQK